MASFHLTSVFGLLCCSHPMADGAKGLKVVQGTLSSPSVHRVNVVHLPELSLHGTLYHLIQLFERKLCQPGVVQHLLAVCVWGVPDLHVQLVGVQSAVLTHTLLSLQVQGSRRHSKHVW